jgi:uncharacterized protein
LPSDTNALIEREKSGLPWWTVLLFVVALLVLCSLVVVALQAGGLDVLEHPLLLTAVLYGAAIAAVLVAVAPLGRGALTAIALAPAAWRPIVLGSLGTLGLSIAASQLGPEVQGMKQVETLVREPGVLLPSVVLLGGLAPLAEELVFRGLLYGWIEGFWTWAARRSVSLPGHWASIVAWLASSFLFAAAHYEPAHIILVLPLGLLFGWLRRHTRSLLPSLVAHIVNNSFAVLSLVYINA